MLSIRLSRVGKPHAPIYRLVVLPKTRDPWAKHVEILGTYNPRTKPKTVEFKVERIKHWLSKGAQPSETVWNLFVDQKIVEGKKRNVTTISTTRRASLNAKKAEATKAQATPAETPQV
mgnify:FL=1